MRTVFARRGAELIALDLDEAKARATVEALAADGGRGSALQCDVSDPADVDAVFDRVRSIHPRIDILVNNAGIAHVGTIEQTTPEDLERLYRVNIQGVFLCARRRPADAATGRRRDPQHGVDCLAHRHPGSLRVFDDERAPCCR